MNELFHDKSFINLYSLRCDIRCNIILSLGEGGDKSSLAHPPAFAPEYILPVVNRRWSRHWKTWNMRLTSRCLSLSSSCSYRVQTVSLSPSSWKALSVGSHLLFMQRPKFHLAHHITSRLDSTRSTRRASRHDRVEPFCSNVADDEEAIVLACTSLVVFMRLHTQILFVPSHEIN